MSMQSRAAALFGRDKSLVGMVHVAGLPGTPRSRLAPGEIVAQAVSEAKILAEAGFDAVLLENMHDAPYLRRRIGPEVVAAMTAVVVAVRRAVEQPLGVQILAGANEAAVAVAHAAGAQFVRAEGFVFAAVADEGLLEEASAGPLLRYRRAIGADGIAVLADIKKKHSAHAMTADIDLAETATAAEFFGADGVVVTGAATGRATSVDDVVDVRAATALPVLVGSGVEPGAVGALFAHADALIVGSWFKVGGLWSNPPDADRAAALVAAADAARE